MPLQTPPTASANSAPASKAGAQRPVWLTWLIKSLLWAAGLTAAGFLGLLMVIAVALAVAYPNLPDISDLSDYRPKLPLRVYSSDGVVLGEFGEERRSLTPIKDIPKVMKDAVLAIEDARFFSHGGVDYLGVVRAGLANVGRSKAQGASTITMQVARNVYLSQFTHEISFAQALRQPLVRVAVPMKGKHALTNYHYNLTFEMKQTRLK